MPSVSQTEKKVKFMHLWDCLVLEVNEIKIRKLLMYKDVLFQNKQDNKLVFFSGAADVQG